MTSPLPISQLPTTKQAQLRPPQYNVTLLCPHVSAADCCLHWLTPYGLNHMDMLATHMPHTLVTQQRVVLVKAIKPKTLSNYGAGLLRFTQFCDKFDIPESLPMPCPEWFLSIFIMTHGAGSVSGGTL